MQHREDAGTAARQRDFSLAEAAAVTGLSRVTMRRYLDAGRFPNATRDPTTARRPLPWRIPASDLVAAGLRIGEPMTRPEPASAAANDLGAKDQANELLTEVAVLRAVAAERERWLADLKEVNERLLRALVALVQERPLRDPLAPEGALPPRPSSRPPSTR
jgi:hypothetical protein